MPIRSLTAFRSGCLQPEASLGRLHREVAEQESGPVHPRGIAMQAGIGPEKVVLCEILKGCSLGAVFHEPPNHPFRYAGPPTLACAANTGTSGVRLTHRTEPADRWQLSAIQKAAT